ncbi:MAG TPA: tryptophan 7-halogenase [Thermoanaerobaculia bacterium]|nr:tryptophan 7-halogenase [Thermoanaerobaculia bacterium]
MIDVRIVGGGPAGCACALALRKHAPSLSIELVEVSDYTAPRVGETLPPHARGALKHLGVWDAFVAQCHRPSYGTLSAWGSSAPHANDFVFSTSGYGWHLDRAAFDRMLADACVSRGVHLRHPERSRGTRGAGGAPPVPPRSLDYARDDVRFTVDATGASASIARARGAQPQPLDHLVCFGRFFDDSGGDPRTIVEACEDGWWYTAGLPDGRRFAAFMTDADIARERGVWSSIPPLIAPLLKNADGPITARSAESRLLDTVAGDGWLAVGDAASRFDPLSSQGILKALRSGTFAAYAIADLLTNGDDRGLRRYRAFIADEFAAYTQMRTKFYREERRWPESEFWRRRQLSDVAMAVSAAGDSPRTSLRETPV